MAASVDVGSVLGGRYKVTNHVLTTAEGDSVLDGIDQVLNRPVSLLVAAPANTDHLAQGAREVATGDRHAALQILDLGHSDGATYLITNQSPAADLLDLLVPTEPYVEPYGTDSLGQEIFGAPRDDSGRSSGQYLFEDGTPAPYTATPEPVWPASTHDEAASSEEFLADNQHGSVPTSPQPAAPTGSPVLPPPSSPPASAAPGTAQQAQSPAKVSLWSDEDYVDEGMEVNQENSPSATPTTSTAAIGATAIGATTVAGTAAVAGREASHADTSSMPSSDAPRDARSFPAAARGSDYEQDPYDDDDNEPRKGSRLLVGAVIAVIIVAALIFAISQIGQLMGSTQAAPGSSHSKTASSSAPGAGQSSSASTTQAPPVVAPEIASVNRIVEGDQSLYADYDADLPKTFDGNPATYWQTYEFSNDTFAGKTKYIALQVNLKAVSTVKTVTITQLGGTGGTLSILAGKQQGIDTATEVGTGSFTGQQLTINLPADTQAQYVYVKFTQLPRLTSFRTYPFAVKVAEISIK